MNAEVDAFEAPGYIEHPLSMARLGEVNVVVFPDGQGSAIVHGDVGDGTVVRLQSACQYGEIFHSKECDCRAQLDASIDLMRRERSGVLIHLLAHEGRGAGLRAKATAYRLRVTEGLNTFESYEKQGIQHDSRKYEVATDFLRWHLELRRIRLLTNNPLKIEAVEAAGIAVERLPLVRIRRESSEYLQVKAKHGHLIPERVRTGWPWRLFSGSRPSPPWHLGAF